MFAVPPFLSVRGASLHALAAVVCFHAAYTVPALGVLIFPHVFCVAQLARLPRALHAGCAGLLTALACIAPQLLFFYGIFGSPAVTLWVILAAWIAAFVLLSHCAFRQLRPLPAALLMPFLWTGLEFFRSELYPLRFSWLNVGYALSHATPCVGFGWWGVYGLGFLAAALAASGMMVRSKKGLAGVGALVLLSVALPRSRNGLATGGVDLPVAGVQLEIPSGASVLENLDALAARYADTPLYVLSEYTLDGPVPEPVRAWCRQHGKYLVVGGKQPLANGRYYNTAFVVGPTGEIVFQQAKSVPIQFFDDGLPAPDQQLWFSPWGKIGLCICYDLSYRRVTDRLVALGAQALIVPTMDAGSWGEHEHWLHTRIAPVRASEYGVPIFRLASSGISQAVDAAGRETARAPFPGDAATLSARLSLRGPGTLPMDRFLVPMTLAVTGGFGVYLLGSFVRRQTGLTRSVPAKPATPDLPS